MLLAAVISRPHLCAKSTVGIVILAASSTLNAHPITARDFCRPQLIEGGVIRKARPQKHLVRRSKAKAPTGFNRQRQWRLKTLTVLIFVMSCVRLCTRLYWHGRGRQFESGWSYQIFKSLFFHNFIFQFRWVVACYGQLPLPWKGSAGKAALPERTYRS